MEVVTNIKDGDLVHGEGHSRLPEEHDASRDELIKIIYDMALRLQRNRKTPLAERSQILSRLVKAHTDITRATKSSNTNQGVIAGVIIVPGKEDPSSWPDKAKAELNKAKALLDEASEP